MPQKFFIKVFFCVLFLSSSSTIWSLDEGPKNHLTHLSFSDELAKARKNNTLFQFLKQSRNPDPHSPRMQQNIPHMSLLFKEGLKDQTLLKNILLDLAKEYNQKTEQPSKVDNSLTKEEKKIIGTIFNIITVSQRNPWVGDENEQLIFKLLKAAGIANEALAEDPFTINSFYNSIGIPRIFRRPRLAPNNPSTSPSNPYSSLNDRYETPANTPHGSSSSSD